MNIEIMQHLQQWVEEVDINNPETTASILLLLLANTLISICSQVFKTIGVVIKALFNAKEKKAALKSDTLDNDLKQEELKLKAEELKLKQELLKQEQEKTKQLKLANKKEKAEQKRADELHKLDVQLKEIELQAKKANQ